TLSADISVLRSHLMQSSVARASFLHTTLNCNRLTRPAQYLVVGVSQNVGSFAPLASTQLCVGNDEIPKIPRVSRNGAVGRRDYLVVWTAPRLASGEDSGRAFGLASHCARLRCHLVGLSLARNSVASAALTVDKDQPARSVDCNMCGLCGRADYRACR